jgi:hypothetical protein
VFWCGGGGGRLEWFGDLLRSHRSSLVFWLVVWCCASPDSITLSTPSPSLAASTVSVVVVVRVVSPATALLLIAVVLCLLLLLALCRFPGHLL